MTHVGPTDGDVALVPHDTIRLEPQMSRTKSFALRLAGLAAFALVLAAPFRWY
jgi:hypothetical protein